MLYQVCLAQKQVYAARWVGFRVDSIGRRSTHILARVGVPAWIFVSSNLSCSMLSAQFIAGHSSMTREQGAQVRGSGRCCFPSSKCCLGCLDGRPDRIPAQRVDVGTGC